MVMTRLSALDDFIQTNLDTRELKRTLAVKMTLSKYSHTQIETLLGVTSGFISKWKHRYLAEDIEAPRLAYRRSTSFLSTA
jgi:putative transposase